MWYSWWSGIPWSVMLKLVSGISRLTARKSRLIAKHAHLLSGRSVLPSISCSDFHAALSPVVTASLRDCNSAGSIAHGRTPELSWDTNLFITGGALNFILKRLNEAQKEKNNTRENTQPSGPWFQINNRDKKRTWDAWVNQLNLRLSIMVANQKLEDQSPPTCNQTEWKQHHCKVQL